MRYLFILLLSLPSFGCSDDKSPKCSMVQDQEKRIKLFHECLKLIPKGPTHTTTNDWDEVIEACETAAYYQSKTEVCK